ncbi:MAG TPA: MATE family efflux transporter [Tepidisphaeraceae bacterium]|nr:MATE family efflux transporter [Tepidisphaeraceae bacterium]
MNSSQKRVHTGLTWQLATLAAPVVMSNLSQTLLGVVDTVFMGWVGTSALAAVGLGGMIFLTFELILRGTVWGSMVFVSRAFGAGDKKEAGRHLKGFVALALVIAPLVLLLPLAFRGIFALTRPAPEVARQALTYMNIRLIEIPLWLLYTALSGFCTGIGRTRLPMTFAWISTPVNVLANWVLVFGNLGAPRLGIAGAAWGTDIAVAVQVAVAGVVVYRMFREEYHLAGWEWPTLQEMVRMARVGIPIGVQDFVEVGAFSAFYALLSRIGTRELAASQIANQITALAFMPGFALGSATGSLVGRYLGAGEPRKAESCGYRGAVLGVAFMGVVGLGFLFFPRALASAFTRDPAVLQLAEPLLRVMALYQVFDALNIVFRGALNGAGDTRFTMMVTVLGAWALFVPGAWLGAFVFKWGLFGAWAGAIAYLVLAGVTFSTRFRRGRWKEIQV